MNIETNSMIFNIETNEWEIFDADVSFDRYLENPIAKNLYNALLADGMSKYDAFIYVSNIILGERSND